MTHTSYTPSIKKIVHVTTFPAGCDFRLIYIPAEFISNFDGGDLTRQTNRCSDVLSRPHRLIGCKVKTHLFFPVLARLHRPATISEILGCTWLLSSWLRCHNVVEIWFLEARQYPKPSRGCG
jgi:hypothetical protein